MRSIALFLAITSVAWAQQPSSTSVQAEAIKKCSFLTGEWSGIGVQTLASGQQRNVHQSEKVQTKLDGLVLQIDGLGTDDQGKFVQSVLVVLSFNPALKQYRFHAYDGQGGVLDADASCANGALSWQWTAGSRQIRFSIRLNSKGQWSELGQWSTDAKNWRPLFAITMDRKR